MGQYINHSLRGLAGAMVQTKHTTTHLATFQPSHYHRKSILTEKKMLAFNGGSRDALHFGHSKALCPYDLFTRLACVCLAQLDVSSSSSSSWTLRTTVFIAHKHIWHRVVSAN